MGKQDRKKKKKRPLLTVLERMGMVCVCVCVCVVSFGKKRKKPDATRENPQHTVTFPYVDDSQKILRHKLQREYPGSMHRAR